MINQASKKSKVKHRLTPVSINTVPVTGKFQRELGHSDLYKKIAKARK